VRSFLAVSTAGFALIGALAALSGCDQPRPVYVDGAYVRLNPNQDNPSSGYFTVHGGSEDVTLRSIQTEAAVRAEMHESMMHDKMMHMQAIESVDIPAGSAVAFAPGGKHVMIWKINPQAIAAGKMTFTYIFSNGDRILVDSVIQGPDGKPTGSGPAPSTN